MPTAVLTGGAGFLGNHLAERLLTEGFRVICFDTLLTGSRRNIERLFDHKDFVFIEHNVIEGVFVDEDVDYVLHFASPASPKDYLDYPIHTLKLGAIGTWQTLGLAKATGATFMLASTSEIYGDPLVHPQTEDYWGNVNPIGPRGVYDEAKRYAEAMAMAYKRTHGVPVKINRIFNTFGPRMRRKDGRAVPNFIDQSLRGDPLTIHGDGSQTRSLCYVDDLIEGIFRFLVSDAEGPMNIGNPDETTVLRIAELIRDIARSSSEIVFVERPIDDPERRRPDITRAKTELGWEPRISYEEGLERTIAWAREEWL
ncbi:MAG TPA: UDP-glucuronic acid decarboxylase family protein [Actinomycetota bacterium]|nr:UDP-glucuronic acid decarboxylase family protein [Actinomycetota bacterium]